MRSHLLLVAAFAVGCGETQLGPFQPLPVDARFDVQGNDGLIHIARDRFGVTHIFATSYRDLGFGQGYVMAHDRLAQMDVLRRFATGRLAELFGAVDPSVLQLDKEMRFHRMAQFAEERLNAMAEDSELKQVLLRFANGVNAYVDDVNAGKWPVAPTVVEASLLPLFAPTQFAEWSPVDSLAIMRLFTLAQSWTVPEELELTELDIRARRSLSATAARDLLALAPIPRIGTSFNPADPRGGLANRPPVSDALLASARAFFPRTLPTELKATLGPHALARPFLGSTAFVVGEKYTGENFNNPMAILAADMQLAPSNPSVFYASHQIVGNADDLDSRLHEAAGLMLPGVPVVIAGTNGIVGWAPTRNTFDVNDIYYEDLTNQPDPIVTVIEKFDIGDYGNITGTELVPYEYVPRHGPIIPGHPAGEALSVRYTGYAATDELSAIWEYGHSGRTADVAFGLLALEHGPQFMTIDRTGFYVWASDTHVPTRENAAKMWSTSNPAGAAPFFVLDGRNPTHDWAEPKTLAIEYGRRLEDAVIIADGDPTDATHDGDPLNDDYVGVAYGNSLRDERIRTLVDTVQLPLDEDKIARIQHDTLSTLGERLKPKLVEILSAAASPQTTLAANVLDAWTFETPIGNVSADGNSAATLLFNTWMHHFVQLAIADDLAAIGFTQPLDDDRVARIVYRMLLENQQALCGGNCAPLVAAAATLAVDQLGAVSESWRWGAQHAFKLRPLFPDEQGALLLPRKLEPITSFQIPGDMFSVDRSDGGWADTDFTPQVTTAYRLQLVGSPVGAPLVLRLELPTGAVFDPRDPHYRDLLEKSYLTRTPFDVPFTIGDINRFGESRWELR